MMLTSPILGEGDTVLTSKEESRFHAAISNNPFPQIIISGGL